MRAFLLLTLTGAIAAAQTIEVKSLFQTAPLAGVWKHQMGDDPRWADPAFDDSAWANVQMPEGAVQPGDGSSWYRVRVHLPEHPPGEPLALRIGAFGRGGQAYEVFWNGQLAGVVGGLDVIPWGGLLPAPKAVDVPGDTRDAVIAIRLRISKSGATNRFDQALRTSSIGARQPIGFSIETWHSERLQSVLLQLVMGVSLMIPAVFFLMLPLWRRDAPEYFWFGLWLLSAIVNRILVAYPEGLAVRTNLAVNWSIFLATAIGILGWVGFQAAFFRSRLTRPVWCAAAASLIAFFVATLFTIGRNLPTFTFNHASLALACCQSIIYYELGWRTPGVRERAGAVHVAILAYLALNFVVFGNSIVWSVEAIRSQATVIRTVSLLLFTFAMAILMNQRSARLMSERRRLAREMESAAEIQSLLLTSLPAAGSFYQVDPVYLPASEVGGDFFQILERADGSRLVLVGDVSGKGLKAAMLVSVAIGILRNEQSSSPGQILSALNHGLFGLTGGGFVTCCCARFDLAGTVAIANAGHPAPYADGREVDTESGLPLGIAEDVEYAETVTAGARFTFVSDGVVEAENTARELFGFDRTREISTKSAQEIAEAAQDWGQNDDITVVTVRRNV